MRTPITRATTTSSIPPSTMRDAPTATGDALGPIACAVPVVPKHTAATRTMARDPSMVHLFHNPTLRTSAAARPPDRGALAGGAPRGAASEPDRGSPPRRRYFEAPDRASHTFAPKRGGRAPWGARVLPGTTRP